MITKLYIVSHIFYGHHLYEYIIWAFCACFKEAFGYTPPPPLVEYIVIVQPASVQIWEMWQLGRDTIMYQPA